MDKTVIGVSLAHIRYDTTHRPVVDTTDIIGWKGQFGQFMYTVSFTPFYLENRGGFIVGEWRLPDVIGTVTYGQAFHFPELCMCDVSNEKNINDSTFILYYPE